MYCCSGKYTCGGEKKCFSFHESIYSVKYDLVSSYKFEEHWETEERKIGKQKYKRKLIVLWDSLDADREGRVLELINQVYCFPENFIEKAKEKGIKFVCWQAYLTEKNNLSVLKKT